MPELILKAITPKKHFHINEPALRGKLRTNIQTYLDYVRAQMQEDYNRVPERTKNDYKANPPVRKYKRSGKLRRGWKVIVDPSGESGIVYNDVAYAGYVQGPTRTRESAFRSSFTQVTQARALRKRGWRSISDVARETRRNFITVMNRTIIATKE